MQDVSNSDTDDEIDLRELFITLWAYKLFIAGACALGIFLGGYYALNADKEFTSTAIFKIDESKSGGISLGGELGALASLAGFGGEIADQFCQQTMVTGRIFIEKLDAKLDFQADPYFNTYDPRRGRSTLEVPHKACNRLAKIFRRPSRGHLAGHRCKIYQKYCAGGNRRRGC